MPDYYSSSFVSVTVLKHSYKEQNKEGGEEACVASSSRAMSRLQRHQVGSHSLTVKNKCMAPCLLAYLCSAPLSKRKK